jgi:sterol desaturase/sphingolipid hydroxylase (fatty acid hydroxylase superfamily)
MDATTFPEPSSPPRALPPLPTPIATTPRGLPAPDPRQRRRAPRTRRSTALTVAFSAALVAASFAGYTAAVGIAVLFAISWPLERIWRRHPVGVRRLGLRTDLAYAALATLLQTIGLVVAVIVGVLSLAWLPALAFRPLVAALPTWLELLVAIVLFDLLVYWAHRLSHTVPLFWRFHAVHHSTHHLDWVSGFRAHPFDGLFMAPVFAFFLGAGFEAEITGALAIVQFVVGLWSHLNVRWRLRPLHRIVLTPDFHHWHHADEADAINTNFGVFLPVWDIVFGTYFMPAERRPSRYGISTPMATTLPGQLIHPFRGIRSDWRAWRRSVRRRVRRPVRRRDRATA